MASCTRQGHSAPAPLPGTETPPPRWSVARSGARTPRHPGSSASHRNCTTGPFASMVTPPRNPVASSTTLLPAASSTMPSRSHRESGRRRAPEAPAGCRWAWSCRRTPLRGRPTLHPPTHLGVWPAHLHSPPAQSLAACSTRPTPGAGGTPVCQGPPRCAPTAPDLRHPFLLTAASGAPDTPPHSGSTSLTSPGWEVGRRPKADRPQKEV